MKFSNQNYKYLMSTETPKGKTYELTCAIGKTGNANAEFGAEIVNDIDQAIENINTEFEMKTYWQNVRIFINIQ